MVVLSDLNTIVPKQSRGFRVFGYTILDLADLFQVKPDTIRQWISKDKLDPKSLKSIINLYTLRLRFAEKVGKGV